MSVLRQNLQLRRLSVNICNCRMLSSATSPVAEAPLLQSKRGAVEVVSINRPKALNSLNIEICELMLANLLRWRTSDRENAGCFILKGVGGKAFCAGGDVKAVTQSEAKVADAFFRTEYRMNYGLSISPIPQISIWDGVVMGILLLCA
jgi:enoyl-CoA hydratase/carnithine racemase